MNTKEAIIYESLKLFSINGYDAVSTRMIAKAVNCSNAVIYKHFKSKREILDTITEICKERFLEKRNRVNIHNMNWNVVEDICLDMYSFQTKDEWIVMFRRLLTIEQFKNEEFKNLYKNFFIDIPVDSMEYMFTELIKEGYLKPGNPRVYAMELYAPFFMYHTVKDENTDRLMNELREHVIYFRKNNRTEKCDE